jgi:hypothetical protein
MDGRNAARGSLYRAFYEGDLQDFGAAAASYPRGFGIFSKEILQILIVILPGIAH